ncbi:MAG: DNA starvation/stationary phase protection protein Dps [Gemmatimonadales bacterium]
MTATMREPITIHPTSNDLGTDIVESLNRRLADAIDLQLQAKQAHWNVKGPSFIALHELFERVAIEVAQHADLLAERVVQLGGFAEGGVRMVAERSELSRYPSRIVSGVDHVMALVNALASFGARTRPAIAEAEQAGDPVTADILTQISRDIDKLRWVVGAHAHARR